MEKDQLIIEALKLLLEQTDKAFLDAEQRTQQVRDLLGQMSKETEELRAKRETIQAELAAFLMKPAESGLDLGELTESQFRPSPTSRRAWKAQVIQLIERMLTYGRMNTSEIYSNLKTHGVNFEGIADPRHRVVQILSECPQFESDRTLGWGLKGEDPVAAGSSGATQSLAGQPMSGS